MMKNRYLSPKGHGPKGCRPVKMKWGKIHEKSKKTQTSKTRRVRTFDMIVVRKYNDHLAESKCCHHCIHMMKLVGIRKVYYSTNEGIVMEHVATMTNNPSSGRKKLK